MGQGQGHTSITKEKHSRVACLRLKGNLVEITCSEQSERAPIATVL